MQSPSHASPLMRVVRTPMGRYEVKIGHTKIELGPGELKKLNRLLNTAVEDYAQMIAEDAREAPTLDRQAPTGRISHPGPLDESPQDDPTPPQAPDENQPESPEAPDDPDTPQ